MLTKCYRQLRRLTHWIGHREIYREFHAFTMVPENLFMANLELAQHVQLGQLLQVHRRGLSLGDA